MIVNYKKDAMDEAWVEDEFEWDYDICIVLREVDDVVTTYYSKMVPRISSLHSDCFFFISLSRVVSYH